MKKALLIISLLALTSLSVLFYVFEKYNLLAIAVSILLLMIFFVRYENQATKPREIVLISVMIALGVAGRCLFALTPGFKPVSAIIVITGIYFGTSAGFITGALTALLSNIMFGQGPWTIFQMVAWGGVGIIAGCCSKFKNNTFALIALSIFAAISYSALMDIWTVLSYGNGFTLEVYLTALSASLPFVLLYILSNIIFLFILRKPIGNQLERMKNKYGVFLKKLEVSK